MTKQCGIYEIYCNANGKSYFGSTKDYAGRRSAHLHNLRHDKHPNAHLQRAWDKYGENAFIFRFVQSVHEECLAIVEQLFIDIHRPNVFNIGRDCQCPVRGRKHLRPRTPEYRAKMSAGKMGHVVSAETKAKLCAAWKQRPPATQETRARMSAANMGRIVTLLHFPKN
jgi:group I intron endonuclease